MEWVTFDQGFGAVPLYATEVEGELEVGWTAKATPVRVTENCAGRRYRYGGSGGHHDNECEASKQEAEHEA